MAAPASAPSCTATEVDLPSKNSSPEVLCVSSAILAKGPAESLNSSRSDVKRNSDCLSDDGHRQKKPRLQKVAFLRPGVGEEKYDETSYYFENDLRKVYPYFYTYTTYCKGRWVGKKLTDVFSQEFRVLPAAQFARSIELGLITVNSEKIALDYVLKNNDFIANKVHRHEVAVSSEPIQIIHSADDFFVINKPSSIPVHPCGRYRHNTVMFILAKDHDIRDIKSVHRLDRLTSGLLIFGRTVEKARALEVEIRSRQVEKEYLCRVVGNFPSEPLTCDQPIDVISFKIGICRVTPKGKCCKTTFEKLSFNGKSSVVLCKPHTGRMHQIRVHLQFLGYPILNDPLYNHEAFGPSKGKGGDIGKSDQELVADLIKAHNVEVWLAGQGVMCDVIDAQPCTSVADHPTSQATLKNKDVLKGSQDSQKSLFDSSKTTYDPHCLECNGSLVFRDPTSKELSMYLHAWKYKGKDWSFESPVPDWANESWCDD